MPPLAKHALREILGALRDGFAARDVRLGFALPEGREREIWVYAPGSGLCSSVPTLSAMPPLAKHALREILGALRDGFAACDVRLGFALPEGRKEEFGLCPRSGLVQFSSYAVGYAMPPLAKHALREILAPYATASPLAT